MKYIVTSITLLVAVTAAIGSSAGAAQPGPNYKHLKHLEQIIGHFRYAGKDEEGRAITGEETSQWICNKNHVRVSGIWMPKGEKPVTYELTIGWDAETEQEVMNGVLSTGAIFRRVGHYDKKLNGTVSKQTIVGPDGTKDETVCTLKYTGKNAYDITWTEHVRDGKSMEGSGHIKATRIVEKYALPKDVVAELDHWVGTWHLTGSASNGELDGLWTLKWGSSGQCLVNEYSFSVDGKNSRSSEVYGWDAVSKEYVLFAVYQGGHLEVSRTKLVAPGLLRGPYSVAIDGKTYKGTVEIRRKGPNEFRFTSKGLAEQGIADVDLRGVRLDVDNGVTKKKKPAPAKVDKTSTQKEFEEYCRIMKGRWFNTDEVLTQWMDFGKISGKVTSYSASQIAVDGKTIAGDFFAGKGTGKWLAFWDPVTKQITGVCVFSDGTIWRDVRYKVGKKWQCETTLNHPDGTQETIESVLTVSKDGNVHTYRNSNGTPPGVYHRVAR